MRTKLQNRIDLTNRLTGLGFTFEEANQLRRIEMTLHRWAEMECNGEIERDETTDKPKRRLSRLVGKDLFWSIADRERGALKRLDAIIARHPGLVRYQQGDCRGAALYILRASDIREGESIDSIYTRGVAVCD